MGATVSARAVVAGPHTTPVLIVDQPHLAREWRALTGVPITTWPREEGAMPAAAADAAVSGTGRDWTRRTFDPDSVPLSRSLSDPRAAAARAEALAALEGTTNPTLQSIRAKLTANSDNLHWSPSRGKILVIDMQ